MTRRTDSGSRSSPRLVEPVTSEKTTVTVFRTSATSEAYAAGTLRRDQLVERAPHRFIRQLDVPLRAVVVEQDQPALLVALQRRPCALGVDTNRLGREQLVDDVCLTTRQPQRGLEPECDRSSMRDVVVRRGSLERMRARVAEVEGVALATVVWIAKTDRCLDRGATPHELRLR